MAKKFNPAPGWPTPPEGWEPPAGWLPDPAWGPAPEGWQIWKNEPVDLTGGPDELVTTDMLTNDYLYAIMSNAYMTCGQDDEGDVWVRERALTWLSPSIEKKVLQLYSSFSFNEGVSELTRLKACNDINAAYLIVRARATETQLAFTYDIPFDNPITRRALVAMIRRFASIPHDAVEEFADELVK